MDPEDQTLPPTDAAGPAAASASEDRGHHGAAARRSYECIFCKRGFSNAQALGGHMNIHRKDRAKLQHRPSQAQLPFDITPDPYLPVLAAPRRAVSVQHPASSSPRQLPLFVEAPSSYRSDAIYDMASSRETEHGLGAVELDLELRLGPERRPADASSPAMGMKEFV